jgi:GxxExxY protein
MHESEVGTAIISSSMRVHSALGPGPLESAYELCLAHELTRSGLLVRRQVEVPLRYKDVEVDHAYRLDILVDGRVVVEAKVLDAILPVHRSQLLSYLRLGGFKLGYLLNFNVAHMRDGIVRLVNGL